ncbi:acyltransferase family protein [Rhizobium rhizogenes]|uniref:acyltransferase family protein n=1 Tax=Rhizobium rhizogenes TaxID=359 RepID=UPI0028686B18|nr:acyltransferase family protein [Rhizobium rhizogenes]
MLGMSRRHDLDFVRVAAFMLLILYHVSLMYNSRVFLLKAPDSSPVFDVIHLWTHPWRMSLLFLISGAVTGILLKRHSPDALRSARTRQLLMPFVLGLLFLIPPQMYVWLRAGQGVDISFTDLLWHYATFTPVPLPNGGQALLIGLQHLWYLAYLWLYTALITLAVSIWPNLLSTVGNRLAVWLSGRWMLIMPALLFVLLKLLLRPAFPQTLDIVTDWYSHAAYLLSFLLGAIMTSRDDYWDTIVRMRKPAMILAVTCAIGLVVLFPALPSDTPEIWRVLTGRVFGGIFQWSAIVAILGYARIWCRSENAVVRYLNKAILTYYVLHQTVMLLIAYELDRAGLLSASSFIPIAVATFAVCALSYELKRRVEASWKAVFPMRAA